MRKGVILGHPFEVGIALFAAVLVSWIFGRATAACIPQMLIVCASVCIATLRMILSNFDLNCSKLHWVEITFVCTIWKDAHCTLSTPAPLCSLQDAEFLEGANFACGRLAEALGAVYRWEAVEEQTKMRKQRQASAVAATPVGGEGATKSTSAASSENESSPPHTSSTSEDITGAQREDTADDGAKGADGNVLERDVEDDAPEDGQSDVPHPVDEQYVGTLFAKSDILMFIFIV